MSLLGGGAGFGPRVSALLSVAEAGFLAVLVSDSFVRIKEAEVGTANAQILSVKLAQQGKHMRMSLPFASTRLLGCANWSSRFMLKDFLGRFCGPPKGVR